MAHASEIAAEEGKPFTLVTLTGDILGLGIGNTGAAPPTEDAVATLEVLPVLEA